MAKSSPVQSEPAKKPLSQRVWLLLLFLPLLPPVSLILLWAGHPKLAKAAKLFFSLLILGVFVAWLGLIIISVANATGMVGRSLLEDPLGRPAPAAPVQQPEAEAAAPEASLPPEAEPTAAPAEEVQTQETYIEMVEQPGEVESIPTAPPEMEAQESLYIINNDEYAPEFHYPTCPKVEEIPDQNYLEVTSDREDVVFRGFIPCRHCNP